jgi:uncharacterized protein YuzE
MTNKNISIINYDPSTDALYVVTRGGEEEGKIGVRH